MSEKEARTAQVKSHEALMKGAFASETAATVAAAIIYEEGEGSSLPLPDAPFEATETIVARTFGAETLYREGKGKTIVIDPGSFTCPAALTNAAAVALSRCSVWTATFTRFSEASKASITTATRCIVAGSSSATALHTCPTSCSLVAAPSARPMYC